MKKYALYLFDFDYTLVNSEAAILKCFHLTLDKTGWPQRDDDVIRRTIGLPMLTAIKKIIRTDNKEKAREFLAVYKHEADRYMTAGTHFFPHTVETLRRLRENGAKVGIISSKTRCRIQEKFDCDGIPELIDHIVGSDDVTAHKPDPEGIRKALSWFHIPADQALYTGDSYVDADAAQQAGVDFAAVTTGTTSKETFLQYPHIQIMQDIKELLFLD